MVAAADMDGMSLQVIPAGMRRSISTPNFRAPQLALPWQTNHHTSTTTTTTMPQPDSPTTTPDNQLTIASLAEAFNRRPPSAKLVRSPTPTTEPPDATPHLALPTPQTTLATPAAAAAAAAAAGTEVYVVARPFTEWGGGLMQKLSPEVKAGMVDVGVCHYMTIFRTPDGRLTQFDFGPRGGDVRKVRGPFKGLFGGGKPAAAAAAGDSKAAGNLQAFEGAAKGVAGEVREKVLSELPPSCMYVGRTNLTLSDVRAYSRTQRMVYELHKNDCRHFVNNLVRYATGFEAATNRMVRHHYISRHGDSTLRWHQPVICTLQLVTDVGNWEKLCKASQATIAGIVAFSSRQWITTLATLKPALALNAASSSFAAVSSAVSMPTWMPAASATLIKRPLATSTATAVATAAAATATLRENPVAREVSLVVDKVRCAATVAVANIGKTAKRFGAAAASARSQGVALSRNASDTTAALAAAAGRRAAAVLQRRLPRAWPSVPGLAGGQQVVGRVVGFEQQAQAVGQVVVLRR